MALAQTFNQDAAGNIGVAGLATTAAPTYSDGTESPLSLTPAGAVRTDASATTQPVSATSLPLPTGASTSALQTTGNSTLSTISGQLPATIGQHVEADSLSVVIASDQTVPISAASLPLPTGAATSANQTSEIAQLTAINGKLPTALGAQTIANSFAVNIASDQVVPVSNAAAASSTSTLTNVAASASSVSVLASNAVAKGRMFFNDSTAIAYVAYASSASITSFTIKMQPQAFYESDSLVYKGAVSAIWASATGTLRVTELT